MSKYYYAVIPKNKLLVRLGSSWYDKEHYDRDVKHFEAFSDYMYDGFYRDGEILDKFTDLIEKPMYTLKDTEWTFGDIEVVRRMQDQLFNIAECWMSFAVWGLFHDEIDEVVGEEHLDDERFEGYTTVGI